MTMLREIIAEIAGMFVSDARLTLSVLAVVAGSAALIKLTPLDPLAGGIFLLAGCLLVLVENVRRSARPK